MMHVATPMYDDIESVLARLSDQHRGEFSKVGFPSQDFTNRLLQFLWSGDTKALYFNGKPQAILSIKADPSLGPITWLLCTTEYFENGLPALRASRKYMQNAVKRHGPIHSFVGSDHPAAAKWMRALGFTFIADVGNTKLFRYT
ncbi:MAG: hypothetical protein IH622_13690 [Ochrobactrum anthropi]|uniref:Uncharacterized protein n=1 Tax=Brucella anthropi TaxID=529 RepID=A0A8I0N705_BRUAN|nr:hypothetical protein [Brucella anthropi]MBE0561850.1 hypothetical protein [Brucella anthropi]